jgi:hypothetical protein
MLALMLAKLKKAKGGVNNIEIALNNPSMTDARFVHLMGNLSFLTDYSVKKVDKIIKLLYAVRKKVEKYDKGL